MAERLFKTISANGQHRAGRLTEILPNSVAAHGVRLDSIVATRSLNLRSCTVQFD